MKGKGHMKKSFKILLFFLSILLMTRSAFALDLGNEITIWDTDSPPTGQGIAGEDNETEPNTLQGQHWDLEGFFVNSVIPSSPKLFMVGGYNFRDGYPSINPFAPGDVFIDVDGDAKWGIALDGIQSGNGNHDISNSSFLYDYAIDFSYDPGASSGNQYKYTVYQLNSESLVTVWYDQNELSNPWKVSDSASPNVVASGDWTFYHGLLDSEVTGGDGNDLRGTWTSGDALNTHYAVELDMSWILTDQDYLDNDKTFLSHFTYECGNDNLMGEGSAGGAPIPEPATMFLLGSGLVGLAGFSRKWRRS